MAGPAGISREDARAQGLKRYYTGISCRSGHLSERFVSGGNCCECLSSWRTAWREGNRDEFNARARKDRAENVERARASTRKWQSTAHGRAIKLEIENRRRARKMGLTEHYTKADVQEILAAQKHRCAYCRTDVRDGYEADHIVPLARGGSDGRRNIQIVCSPCNRQKQAKDPVRHARDLGMLI